jgi:starch-binding outer membrane protein, SusD/RagB family
MKIKNIIIAALIPVLIGAGACQKEYLNPNAATSEDALSSVDGLLGMVVGIKRTYSVGALSALYNMVSANGLSTRELYVINTGNGELAALEAGGGTVGNSNAFVNNIWTSSNIVNANSQLLIDNASRISDPATSTAVLVYGHFFKALAIGTMAQFWEQVPTQNSSAADFLEGRYAEFKPRAQALADAIALLEAGVTAITATPPSTYFNSKVGTDINIADASNALLARYYNMLGQHDNAIAAANKVNLSRKSSFKYDVLNQNPVFRTALVNNNTYDGRHNFGLPTVLAPDAADGRIAFYLGANPVTNVKVQGFFTADNKEIPVFLPGEMMLIKAEAQARKNNLPAAIAELNAVLQKNNDIFGVNANLPAYSGPQTQEAVLTEIYRNRCIELYMTGLKLEDSRRFGRPGAPSGERNRNFYPYPLRERDNNPNTPADPEI